MTRKSMRILLSFLAFTTSGLAIRSQAQQRPLFSPETNNSFHWQNIDAPKADGSDQAVRPLLLTPPEKLSTSYYDANNVPVNAVCLVAHCLANAPMFNENIVCPGAIGATCTYEIVVYSVNLVGGNSIAGNEPAAYQFLVDLGIPNGGATNAAGYTQWQGAVGPVARVGDSFMVYDKVANTAANQAHNILVGIACDEGLGDPAGCTATAFLSTLSVRVLKP